jgi:hypothetical protein
MAWQFLSSAVVISAAVAAGVARVLGTIGQRVDDLLEGEWWASAPLAPDPAPLGPDR